MHEISELLRNATAVSIFLALVSIAASIWQLTKGLKHRDETERASVEVAYLRAAIDVCHVPIEALHMIAFEISHHVILREQPARVHGGLAEPIQKAWNEFSREMDRYNKAIKVTSSFARAAGAESLELALVAARASSNGLATLLPSLMDGRITAGSVEETSEFKRAVADADVAADLLVGRIAGVYGVQSRPRVSLPRSRSK